MANKSIYDAFERLWQHIIHALSNKADSNHTHDNIPTIHHGTTEPTSDIGEDGDIYIMYEEE